jgi:hypothetical protein
MLALAVCRKCPYFAYVKFGDPVKGEYVVCGYEYDDRITPLLFDRGRVMVNCPRGAAMQAETD